MKVEKLLRCLKCDRIIPWQEYKRHLGGDYFCKACDLHWFYRDGILSYFHGAFNKVFTVPEGTLPIWQEQELEKISVKTCIKCGNLMKPGMLPGWHLCQCGLYLDIQELPPYNLIQYRRTPNAPTITVPNGCLLILRDTNLKDIP